MTTLRSDSLEIIKYAKSEKKKGGPGVSSAVLGGATVAGVGGAVAGGVPGRKSDLDKIKFYGADTGDFSRRNRFKTRMSSTNAVAPGGIFGARDEAHSLVSNGVAEEKKTLKPNKGQSGTAGFKYGQAAGKLDAEKQVRRHLMNAKRMGNAALVGGGVVAAGVGANAYRKRRKNKEEIGKSDRKNKALRAGEATGGYVAGAAGTGAVTAGGLSVALDRQGKYWEQQREHGKKAGEKIDPKAKGNLNSRKVADNLKGSPAASSEKIGFLRGRGTQGGGFASEYRPAAKIARKLVLPAAGLSAAGATGAYLARKKREKNGTVQS